MVTIYPMWVHNDILAQNACTFSHNVVPDVISVIWFCDNQFIQGTLPLTLVVGIVIHTNLTVWVERVGCMIVSG